MKNISSGSNSGGHVPEDMLGSRLDGGKWVVALPKVWPCPTEKRKANKGKAKVGESYKRPKLGTREGQLTDLLLGTLSSFPRPSFSKQKDSNPPITPLVTGETLDNASPTTVSHLPDLPASGSSIPPEPLVKSLRVPPSSRAPGSTIVVYKGPLMVKPSSWRTPLLRSLGDDLQGNPLEALTNLLLVDYMKGVKRVSVEWLVDMLIHDHLKVSPLNFLFLFWLSSFCFLFLFLFFVCVLLPGFSWCLVVKLLGGALQRVWGCEEGIWSEVVEIWHMLVRCSTQEKHLKEFLEAKDRDLMGRLIGWS
jgi:hypothetical protein